ncbi:carbohydrate ABC transporter substrate-binding protein (CUT1 family) [Rathayibacter sp. PhB93]|uniref:ABC transporter substrate-binding protein n=1 Tax=unclassified Rathayibacter TaxID=2609250 RepID=UPI000F473D96|nr:MULTISPECIES: extracellular solute-binding protein [unclassified Rathayibacter]ROQ04553.1 carbohydrate ABC transporter substrate-binding protein (CUT1 family) [Rathayibacter sp. PhB93]TDQ13391.1 carbohydrate ABC transporter substrate-binding protein (CUT1 family) [Rathayibacter sp. PhB1]
MISTTTTPRRRWAAAVLAIGLAASLAACSQGSASGGGDAAAGGSLTLNGDRADFTEAYSAAGTALEGVGGSGIEPRNVPSTENYQQVIRSSLQTSSTTDLVKWWNGYRLQDLARSGGLADLTEEWDAAEAAGQVNPESRDSFSYDGKVYGMPMYKSYWVMFYNKKDFETAGITPPTTWAQFESNNDALKAAGFTPLFGTQEAGWTSFIWFEELLSKSDPDFYTKLMNGEASYTDQPAQDALKLWGEMYAKGWFTAPDVAWDNEPALFAEGTVAQVPMGSWRNGAFAALGLGEEDYGAYLLPSVSADVQPSVIVESGVISVAEKSPNRDEAVKTMGDWLDPEVQSVWANAIKDTSANPTVVTDDPTLASISEQVTAEQPTELVRYWEASPPALIEGGVQYLASFMVDPSDDNILPTLEKLQALADSEWAKWEAAE